MPKSGPQPIVTPLAAARLKPIFVDRSSDEYCLRTLKPVEVTPEITDWLTDPAVMEGLNAPQKLMGIDAFRTYVASFDNLRRNLMALRLKADDRAMGLFFLEVDLRHRLGSLHLVIGKPYRHRRNLAYKGTDILTRHAFFERGLEKLTFQPLSRNAAAVGVCLAADLRLEGILRAHRIDGRTGERLDQMVFAITREEYAARPTKADGTTSVRP